MPYLAKSLGQHVLSEALNELMSGYLTLLRTLGLRRSVSVRDMSVVALDDPIVSDGYSVDVWSQVFEHRLSTADWLHIHDPLSFPDTARDLREQSGLLHASFEERPVFGDHLGVHKQEVRRSGEPLRSIIRDGPTGDYEVHMRMKPHRVTAPCVKHSEEPQLAIS
jgi:hypothetical protein